MNLQLDDFDEEYIRSATVKSCPHCGIEVQLSALVVGHDAYRALYRRKLYRRQSAVERNIDLYLAYASDIRRISKATGRPLRDVDEQLYCFDLEQNGRI